MGKATTIKDIAKELNISISTVSRALQNHPDISEHTKQVVRDCALQLNYRPNLMASNLRTNRNTTIGVILPEVNHNFFGSVLDGIEQTAGQAGYTTIICQTGENVEKEIQSIYTLMQGRIAGMLIGVSKGTTQLNHLREIMDSQTPLVLFDRPCPSLQCDQVISDDYVGAYSAVEYLIQTGCKHIVYFSAPMQLEIARRRFQGFRDAIQHYNLPLRDEDVVICDTRSQAIIETPIVMHRADKPDAIFCVNDNCASGVLYAAQMLGIAIPDELSICGFSDDPLCRNTSPMLTSVQQHGFDMGCAAMKQLLKRIDGDTYLYKTQMISTDLIVRETTK